MPTKRRALCCPFASATLPSWLRGSLYSGPSESTLVVMSPSKNFPLAPSTDLSR